MDAQAGWYDDGSGRQRYWDGQQWTNNYGTPLTQTPVELIDSNPVAPILGYVGLGLAVIGTILAFIPLTFILGVIVLFAGFVVSLIGLFKKNTAKWPSIVGMILSVIGGAIGTIVVLVVIASSLVNTPGPVMPVDDPSSNSTESPSVTRPSPEELAVGVKALLNADGITTYDNDPTFYSCIGQYLYDSELSDEALIEAAAGRDIINEERELAIEVSTDAAIACDK